jgi:hypothetical protein
MYTKKGYIQCYINLENLIGLTFFILNGLKLFFVGGLSMFLDIFLISYCACCKINLLDLVWTPHGVSKHHVVDFIRSNSHSSSMNAISNQISSVRCFLALSKISSIFVSNFWTQPLAVQTICYLARSPFQVLKVLMVIQYVYWTMTSERLIIVQALKILVQQH